MTKILVTGGTGFIGSYIIKQLVEKGYLVRAMRRDSSQVPRYIPEPIFNKVEWVSGDILDVVSLEDAMTGVDAVIHSAAIISFSRGDKKKMYKINIEGTANTVNIALEKNIKRLVHVSSVAAIGRTPGGDLVNEDKKWQENKTNTAYAISKHRSEIEVWRGMAEGLPAVILNPSTVIGYGDWTNSSCRIFKTVYDEFPWYTTGINGFVDVEDVARAALLLMESDINGERFIVNADNWSFQKLFNSIADAFGKKHPGYRATPLLGEIAWRVEKLKSFLGSHKPLLTRETATVAHSKTYFDNKKILLQLPEFSFTPLEESIRNACYNYLNAINKRQP